MVVVVRPHTEIWGVARGRPSQAVLTGLGLGWAMRDELGVFMTKKLSREK